MIIKKLETDDYLKFLDCYVKSVVCSDFYEFNYASVNKELFLQKVPKSHDKFSLTEKVKRM